MLFPKKVKHRKWHTMRRNPNKPRVETRGVTLAFGGHGLKAFTPGRIRSQHIESARKAIMHELKKSGKLWIRVFPDKPYTGKPAEVGMGKGKGDPQGYEFIVWPGRVIFEIDGVETPVAREALRKAGAKLPFKTKIISRV
jgi:large subunit ribosomal protein L16